MAIQNSRSNKHSTTHRIRGTNGRKAAVPMARQKDVPAGKYRSQIVKISFKKTLAGDDAVEIIYELTAPDGVIRKMREVIPCDSWAYERFCDALLAAGLEEDGDVADAVGVTEDVHLTYLNARGLGHFAKRTPVITDSSPGTLVDDDEDDRVNDLLDDDEELVEDDDFEFDLD